MGNKNNGNKIGKLTDEELVHLVKNNNKTAFESLIICYLPLIYNKARDYKASGLDEHDFVQEGIVSLLAAAKGFDPANGASFKTFFNHCLENKFCTITKSSDRQKNIPLNKSVSLDDTTADMVANIPDPEQDVIDIETLRKLRERVSFSLTRLELSVLNLHLFGLKYSEIAENLNISEKSVDNALQRIRKKTSLLTS